MGGADLAIVHESATEGVVGTPFSLGIEVTNNGGQEEDDTADNLLILTYSEPQLPKPASLPEGCEGEVGLVMCTKDQLVAEDRFGYTLNFEFRMLAKFGSPAPWPPSKIQITPCSKRMISGQIMSLTRS